MGCLALIQLKEVVVYISVALASDDYISVAMAFVVTEGTL